MYVYDGNKNKKNNPIRYYLNLNCVHSNYNQNSAKEQKFNKHFLLKSVEIRGDDEHKLGGVKVILSTNISPVIWISVLFHCLNRSINGDSGLEI